MRLNFSLTVDDLLPQTWEVIEKNHWNTLSLEDSVQLDTGPRNRLFPESVGPVHQLRPSDVQNKIGHIDPLKRSDHTTQVSMERSMK